jgi:catechol 2,3-dioxygenase-like lactoylglutathione lyase family enzyme
LSKYQEIEMEAPICQVALSVTDRERSLAWYENLGFEHSGSMGPLGGDVPARLVGLPAALVRIEWALPRDPMTQFELIQFLEPQPRKLFPERNLLNAGYGLVSIVAPDFSKALAVLRAAGSLVGVSGTEGSRSIWTRDPDGVAVEIMERDPLGEPPAARGAAHLSSIRSVALTVEDLGKAARFWTETVGLTACPPGQFAFNPFPADLCGGVARWEQETVKGGSMLLRLLSPRGAPVIAKPADYRLSDVGILNVAVIFDTREPFDALLGRFRSKGYPLAVASPMELEGGATMYGHDDQRNSIEMGFALPQHVEKYGWRR